MGWKKDLMQRSWKDWIKRELLTEIIILKKMKYFCHIERHIVHIILLKPCWRKKSKGRVREVDKDTNGKITSWGGWTVVYQCILLGQELEIVGDPLQATFSVEMAPDWLIPMQPSNMEKLPTPRVQLVTFSGADKASMRLPGISVPNLIAITIA